MPCVARYLDDQWDVLDHVEPFTVVDAGAGPGTLARTILAARPRCAGALRYIAVETSARQRALHPTEVESRPDVPDGPLDGVIVANELLDNLPFRLCVFDGGWREAFVTVAADGAFAEVLTAPLDPPPAVLPASPPHGSRAPLARRRRRLGLRCPLTPSRRPPPRCRLRPHDDGRAGAAAVASVVADISRARSRRPLSR